MGVTITIGEAQVRLSDLISQLAPGEEIIITENDQPVAKVVVLPKPPQRRQPGLCKGMITIVSDDDEHLDDFADYMP